jgi:hypothetical protein
MTGIRILTQLSEHMDYKIYLHYQLRVSYIEKNSILIAGPSKTRGIK